MTEEEFKQYKAKANKMMNKEFMFDLDDLVDCPYWDYFKDNGGEFTKENFFEFVAMYDDLFSSFYYS